jgi:CRISPR/Cas system-associated exonuclease Cas4 (RecB family)
LDPQDSLISAGFAAASWARARRASWTSAPLVLRAVPGPLVSDAVVPAAIVQPAAPADPVAAPSRPRFTLGTPPRWLTRGALAAALLAALVVGARFLWNAMPEWPARTAVVEPAKVTPKATASATGSLRVSSTPSGARVLVDGKPRGVTPLNLTDLSPGRHDVVLESDAGSVKRTVTVSTTAAAVIDEAIFSGFVTVYAPFDVTVSEKGRVLRADDRHQIMLPPGAHELRVFNRSLAYDVARRVEVRPGEAVNLQLTPDPSSLTVTAAEAAEVWVDGSRLGDTPLNAAPIPLGIHDIVVRRATGGERRFTVTVGTKPVTLNVVF